MSTSVHALKPAGRLSDALLGKAEFRIGSEQTGNMMTWPEFKSITLVAAEIDGQEETKGSKISSERCQSWPWPAAAHRVRNSHPWFPVAFGMKQIFSWHKSFHCVDPNLCLQSHWPLLSLFQSLSMAMISFQWFNTGLFHTYFLSYKYSSCPYLPKLNYSHLLHFSFPEKLPPVYKTVSTSLNVGPHHIFY